MRLGGVCWVTAIGWSRLFPSPWCEAGHSAANLPLGSVWLSQGQLSVVASTVVALAA